MYIYVYVYIYNYVYVYVYLSGKITFYEILQNSGGTHKASFLQADLVLTYQTFYDTSIGEIRFGGTFRISDLQGVGLWSDFEIFGGQFRKTHQKMRFYVNINDLKSDRQNIAFPQRNLCSNTSKNHVVFTVFPHKNQFSTFISL